MATDYPLRIHDYRTLPEGYDGPVFIWDIDKTYLTTHFSSLRGLLRIPVEFAVDKRAIPGMPEVLRGLRRGPGPGVACAPLYFVTASPPLLRPVIEQKMLLDGVEYDGITFKDWMRTLKERRPKRLKEQMGFKLCALLEGRSRRPMAAEYLFGDDVEIDADAYSLYARLLQGEISAGDAEDAMTAAGVRREDRKTVFRLLDRLPRTRGVVERIFIHLAKKSPPERFRPLGDRVVPVKSAFQLGLALWKLNLIDADTPRQARDSILSGPGSSRDDLDEEVADAIRRGLITSRKVRALDLPTPPV